MKIGFTLATSLSLLNLVGCITRGSLDDGNLHGAYGVSPSLTNNLAIARQTLDAIAPFNPFRTATDIGFGAAALLLTSISGLIAKRKSDEARREASAADSLAETVVINGLVPHAMEAATANDVLADVYKHVNNNSLTQKTK